MSRTPWTTEQRTALMSEGDTLLVANAGTGKTTTVVGKILWLLGLDGGPDVAPCAEPCGLHEIAAITFTEKAAYDLKRKLRKEIEASERARDLRWEIDRATIGTIHAFCGALLREHALRLGIDPTFRVLDEREATVRRQAVVREVVMEALEARETGVPEAYRRFGLHGYENQAGLLEMVERVLSDLAWHPARWEGWRGGEGRLDPERLRALCETWTDGVDDEVTARCDALARLGGSALERWRAWLEGENARDFDRLILDAHELLTGARGRAAVAALRRRYRILVVDEFQDTDAAQRDIVFAIGRGQERPQLFLVGDPKQSIYRFRGADVAVWNQVADEVRQDGRVLDLTRNFRSRPQVVDYVNVVAAAAMDASGAALKVEEPGGVVDYAPLEPGRDASTHGGVEWLVSDGDKAEDRRRSEADHVARRIRQMVGAGSAAPLLVEDPDTGEERPCRFRDVAILYRTRYGVEHYEEALTRHGVPLFHSDPPRLEERQEVLDLVNALRLVDNPFDDLRAFAYLRSPFVGLRDETLALLRMEAPRHSLYYLARAVAEAREEAPDPWSWSPPEDHRLPEIERGALVEGIAAVEEAHALASRIPLDELASLLLRRTGYRLHLHVRGRAREADANLRAFLRMMEEYRDRPLGAFLEIWDRWDRADTGVPSAPLHSKDDDVVTLSTIHRAKGLEWPIVFLVDLDGQPGKWRTGSWISDRRLGPVLLPKKAEAGRRASRIEERNRLEEAAEEARLLYVATTRARERLVLAAPSSFNDGSYAAWLVGPASDASGPAGEAVVSVRTEPPPLAPPPPPAAVGLERLDRIEGGEAPAGVRPLPEPPLRFATSATEMMLRASDPDAWTRRYVHGVQAPWEFAPRTSRSGGVPADVRGTVIHGVLERLEEERELGRVLDEAIGELENPEVEALLSPGTRYRRALEDEIRTVVSGAQWAWYVEGEHHREMGFAHLVGPREWRLGAFDLYRPGGARAPGAPGPSPAPAADANLDLFTEIPAVGTVSDEAWIIDFKTHVIDAAEAARVAQGYAVQAKVYREAAAIVGPARVRFHFTHP
ncbi:MAG: UvrD-helicase domain-containing protein, partial [Gemmatimonadetes bacterium]|nr:UvrD-helicase domain-containing protein [Gemmatimonadota bacterium]